MKIRARRPGKVLVGKSLKAMTATKKARALHKALMAKPTSLTGRDGFPIARVPRRLPKMTMRQDATLRKAGYYRDDPRSLYGGFYDNAEMARRGAQRKRGLKAKGVGGGRLFAVNRSAAARKAWVTRRASGNKFGGAKTIR